MCICGISISNTHITIHTCNTHLIHTYIGKGAQAANTELEKLYNRVGGSDGITCAEATKQLAQM